jgi:hypothetical protein
VKTPEASPAARRQNQENGSFDQTAVKCAIINAANSTATFSEFARDKMKTNSLNDHFCDLQLTI